MSINLSLALYSVDALTSKTIKEEENTDTGVSDSKGKNFL